MSFYFILLHFKHVFTPVQQRQTLGIIFDSHNYCPTCREAGKGDDPCVTLLSPCEICASFTEEQQTKITHRKRYIKRDKKSDKNDGDTDLLGDNSVDLFGGSQAELEVAADRLFSSPLALNLLPSRRYP